MKSSRLFSLVPVFLTLLLLVACSRPTSGSRLTNSKMVRSAIEGSLVEEELPQPKAALCLCSRLTSDVTLPALASELETNIKLPHRTAPPPCRGMSSASPILSIAETEYEDAGGERWKEKEVIRGTFVCMKPSPSSNPGWYVDRAERSFEKVKDQDGGGRYETWKKIQVGYRVADEEIKKVHAYLELYVTDTSDLMSGLNSCDTRTVISAQLHKRFSYDIRGDVYDRAIMSKNRTTTDCDDARVGTGQFSGVKTCSYERWVLGGADYSKEARYDWEGSTRLLAESRSSQSMTRIVALPLYTEATSSVDAFGYLSYCVPFQDPKANEAIAQAEHCWD